MKKWHLMQLIITEQGHFLGTQHTLDPYKKVFYASLLSDWSNYGQWTDNGNISASQCANKIWKKSLSEYQKPHMEESELEDIEAFFAKRKESPQDINILKTSYCEYFHSNQKFSKLIHKEIFIHCHSLKTQNDKNLSIFLKKD